MDFEAVRQTVLSFPGVEEYLAFGRPTWRLNGRLLACITKIDPDTLCVKVLDQLDREFLLDTQPDIFLPHAAVRELSGAVGALSQD